MIEAKVRFFLIMQFAASGGIGYEMIKLFHIESVLYVHQLHEAVDVS